MASDHRHHDHHHDHGHPQAVQGRAFAIGIALNLAFVGVEVFYGIVSHSVALLADAGHNLGDVLGLGLGRSWGATARELEAIGAAHVWVPAHNDRRPRRQRTHPALRDGRTGVGIDRRLVAPQPAQGKTMIVVAVVGAATNTASALLFISGSKKDLNVRSAFLHLASDAVLGLGVGIGLAGAGGVVLFTGGLWLDPVASLVLAIAILAGTSSLMEKSLNLMLDALPAHLVMPGRGREPSSLVSTCKLLPDRFDIDQTKLKIDPEGGTRPVRPGFR